MTGGYKGVISVVSISCRVLHVVDQLWQLAWLVASLLSCPRLLLSYQILHQVNKDCCC